MTHGEARYSLLLFTFACISNRSRLMYTSLSAVNKEYTIIMCSWCHHQHCVEQSSGFLLIHSVHVAEIMGANSYIEIHTYIIVWPSIVQSFYHLNSRNDCSIRVSNNK